MYSANKGQMRERKSVNQKSLIPPNFYFLFFLLSPAIQARSRIRIEPSFFQFEVHLYVDAVLIVGTPAAGGCHGLRAVFAALVSILLASQYAVLAARLEPQRAKSSPSRPKSVGLAAVM
jgi:hypothetical protein